MTFLKPCSPPLARSFNRLKKATFSRASPIADSISSSEASVVSICCVSLSQAAKWPTNVSRRSTAASYTSSETVSLGLTTVSVVFSAASYTACAVLKASSKSYNLDLKSSNALKSLNASTKSISLNDIDCNDCIYAPWSESRFFCSSFT